MEYKTVEIPRMVAMKLLSLPEEEREKYFLDLWDFTGTYQWGYGIYGFRLDIADVNNAKAELKVGTSLD